MTDDQLNPTIDTSNPQKTDSKHVVSDATNAMDLKPGSRYLIGSSIAKGGMGIVLRATDTVLQREVAIKTLQDRFIENSMAERRFADEARITGQLQHPAIPPVHDFGRLPNGTPFLAMKLIKGESLDELLKRRVEVDQDRGRFLAVFEQIAQAIAYAHSHNVIHRDLKPANVMVGSFGEVQVMDWGLGKILDANGSIEPDTALEETLAATQIRSAREDDFDAYTMAGSVLGTPAYMPPEQAIGAIDQIGKASDVFGLGAILAVILTGKPPYVAETSETTRQMAARGKVNDCFARLQDSGAAPEWIALCQKCLSPEPMDRFADANIVATMVAQLRTDAEDRARKAEIEKASFAIQAEEERKRADLELRLANEKQEAERKQFRLRFQLSAFVALTLLVGVCLSLWQAYRARTAELATIKQLEETRKAELQAKLARDRARDVLDTMTSDVAGDSLMTEKEIRPEQKKLLREVLQHYQELAKDDFGDEATQGRTADAAYRISIIQYRLGLSLEVLVSLDHAIELTTKLAKDRPANPKYLESLGLCYINRGATLSNAFEIYEDALESHRQARSIFENLTKSYPEEPKNWKMLVSCLRNMNVTLELMGRKDEAYDCVLQALAIAESFQAKFPEASIQEEKADVLLELAEHTRERNDDEAFKNYATQAIAAYDSLLLEDASNPKFRVGKAHVYILMGAYHSEFSRDNAAAIESFRNGEIAYRALFEEFPEMLAYRSKVAECEHNIGVSLFRMDQFDDSLKAHEESLAIRLTLLQDDPTNKQYLEAVETSYKRVGEILRRKNRYSQALEIYQRLQASQKERLQESPEDSQYLDDYASTLENLGDCLKNQSQNPEALEVLQQSIPIREKLKERGFDHKRNPLYMWRNYKDIGEILRTKGNYLDARETYEKMVSLAKEMVGKEPTNPNYVMMEKASEMLRAYVMIDLNIQRNDLEALLENAAYFDRSAAEDPDEIYSAACVWAKIGRAFHSAPEKQEEYFQKSMSYLVRTMIGPNYSFESKSELAEHMLTDHDMDALRERADYKQFVQTLVDETSNNKEAQVQSPR